MNERAEIDDDAEEKALEAIDKAVRHYLQVRGDIGGGSVLTGWGLVTSATKLINGEPAYSTSTYQQSGGIPPYTWIGIMRVELQKWINYAAFEQEDEE